MSEISELRIITIDGPAGVGKSSIAKILARDLGLAYLDTGAMYRTLSLHLDDAALAGSEADRGAIMSGLDFQLTGAGDASTLTVNGRPVGGEIRTEEVAARASRLAVLPDVRRFLQSAQQRIGRSTPLVCEGRDMGTKVFPQARHKFFLDAAPEVRAERRFLQLKAQGRPADFELILSHITARDEQDRGRPVDPLRPAPDAALVDTGALDITGVVAAIKSCLRERGL